MSSTVLRKRTNVALQRVLIYAALIAAFAMVIGISLGLGHAEAGTEQMAGSRRPPQACALAADGDDSLAFR